MSRRQAKTTNSRKTTMPHTRTPGGLSAASRKRRQFRAAGPAVSAAVFMPEQLYRSALGAAEKTSEGNFSRYVRQLIPADLSGA